MYSTCMFDVCTQNPPPKLMGRHNNPKACVLIQGTLPNNMLYAYIGSVHSAFLCVSILQEH